MKYSKVNVNILYVICKSCYAHCTPLMYEGESATTVQLLNVTVDWLSLLLAIWGKWFSLR
jgi:hypothetical protein